MMSKENNLTYEEFKKRFDYGSAESRIGSGGHCDVFRAYDKILRRYVAIKISKVVISEEHRNLKKETELAQKLSKHDNIAYYEECYRFDIEGIEFDYAVLEYYENGNLLKFDKDISPNLDQKLSILEGVLKGIHFLHRNNIIHRDLKPENILIFHDKNARKYIPKITDFEASKDVQKVEPSIKIATKFYAAPEQLKEDCHTDYNTDLWCFGITALVFLGVLSPSDKDALKQIMQGTLPSIDFLPQVWQKLIKECLREEPKERIKSCDDCLKIIAGYEQNGSVEVGDEVETEKVSRNNGKKDEKKQPSRIKNMIIAVLAVLLLGVGGSVINNVVHSSVSVTIHIVDWNGKANNKDITDEMLYGATLYLGDRPQEVPSNGIVKFPDLPASLNEKTVRVFFKPRPQYQFMQLDTTIVVCKDSTYDLKMNFKGIDQITRRVIDSDTQQPFVGAEVEINGEKDTTDAEGYFTIKLPLEKQQLIQTLKIIKKGYSECDKNLDMTTSNPTITWDFSKK